MMVGMTIVMSVFMNLGNDFTYNPKIYCITENDDVDDTMNNDKIILFNRLCHGFINWVNKYFN